MLGKSFDIPIILCLSVVIVGYQRCEGMKENIAGAIL